ncbi:MAG TPA: hypothetical protein VLF69_06395 [Candidatus Saccharimonadales bacterium]|nr:hypothetical protein [Candidatus Saccharimonadales bacterium]
MNTPHTVTFAELRQAVPEYVTQAHDLAAAVLQRAITNPVVEIAVRAVVRNAAEPVYQEFVDDPERLAELWITKERLSALEADVPIPVGRLALKASAEDVHVWTYRLPEDAEAGAGKAKAPRVLPWLASGPRHRLEQLTGPGYIFNRPSVAAQAFGLDPAILTYAYSQRDALAGRNWYYGARGITNTTAAYFTEAVAPVCTEEDRQLLEGQSVETYHTHKIEQLLSILRGVVSSA